MDDNTYWIAVVDDDIPNLKIAGSILSENGMRVTALNSGRALTELVRGGIRPDLILLDILMPGMDGFETLAELRRVESELQIRETPVIFLTADDNRETKEKSRALGAVDLIAKPFDGTALARKIESFLSGRDQPVQLTDNGVSAELLRQDLRKQFSLFTGQMNGNGALITDRNGFEAVNRFVTTHIARYGGNVQKVMISISAKGEVSDSELRDAVSGFDNRIGMLLRKSDAVFRSSQNTYLLLLPMVSDAELNSVMERVIRAWNKDYGKGHLVMTFAAESIGAEREKRPQIDGLDWRYAQLNLQNDKLLTSTVREFAESMPDRLDRLVKDFAVIADNDAIDAYRIGVHSMKSAAAAIGLLSLSGVARMLEEYARDKRISDIKTLHPLFTEAWKSTYINICNTFGFNIRDENKDKAAKVSPALLDVLKTGVENMDTEAVSGALTKIMSYEYGPETEAVLQKLKKAAIEFDDSAFEIIKELLR